MKKTTLVLIFIFIAIAVYSAESTDMLQNVLNGDMNVEDIESSFSTANIIGWILFGSIGFVAFMYGKKMSNMKLMFTAAVLIGYPYLIHNTVLLFVIGAALSALAYYFRKD